jgi:hypothetical protein
VPQFATHDTLLGAMYGDIVWHLLAAARCHLPTSLGLAKHYCLIASVMLGGNATRLLECLAEKVTMIALERALCVTLR